MQDDGPALGRDTHGDDPRSPVPKMWMAAAGLAVSGRDEAPVAVEIEDWQEAIGRIGVSVRNAEPIPTPDGERWGATPWDEIMDSQAVGSPDLVTTDELLILIHHSPHSPADLDAVVIGRPLE